MRDVVLLLTHRADHYTIDRVAEEVAQRGARPIRLDTDTFPTEVTVAASLDNTGSAHHVNVGGADVNLEEVRAVWMRRWVSPVLEEVEPELRGGCVRESHEGFAGFLDGLADRRFVNPPAADRTAGDKLRQLRIARSVGLAIPATLMTNDPAKVRAFHRSRPGEVVAKMLTAFSTSMAGDTPFVHTSIVTAEDLEDLDGLRYSPMVFQDRIPKAYELRVAVVDGQCFAGAIDASHSVRGQVDWRRSDPSECEWTPGTVPDDVARRLHQLLETLGLVYGAVDLIVTPAGDHVFLEVNPAGEWGMLEKNLGHPIAAALADALLR